MKQKLFNILPNWLKKLKHADKVAHAFYGTLIYLVLNLFLPPYLSLYLTFLSAISVEFYDLYTKKGNSDLLDVVATIIIPLLLFFIF